MAYVILIDGEPVLDAASGDPSVTQADVSQTSINSCAYLDMEIAPTFSGEITEGSSRAEVDWGDEVLFSGEVQSVSRDIDGTLSVSCVSDLDRLSRVMVPPHSTDGSVGEQCPATVDGYFGWVMSQFARRDLGGYGITVKDNQGALIRDSPIEVSRDGWTSAAECIDDEVLSIGGYLVYEPMRAGGELSLYADIAEASDQVIDFGVNALSLDVTRSSEDQRTAIVPVATGGDERLTLSGAEERDLALIRNAGFSVRGDAVYDQASVDKYGYREEAFEDEVSTTYDLARDSVARLRTLMAPRVTVECRAVDLALVGGAMRHLMIGRAARVRSAAHGLDEYLAVQDMDLCVTDPTQTSYTLGVEYDTLTGQQSAFLRTMNSSINHALDEAQGAMEGAQQAIGTANGALSQVGEAVDKANDAADKAGQAVDKAEDLEDVVYDKTPPGKPLGVGFSSDYGDVTATWGGELDGGIPDDFAYVEFLAGDASIGRISRPGSCVGFFEAGSELQCTAVAVDRNGNRSESTDPVAVTVTDGFEDVRNELAQAGEELEKLGNDLDAMQGALDKANQTIESEITGDGSTLKQAQAAANQALRDTQAQQIRIDELQNVADNAIETWMGDGIPTTQNEPAVDWATEDDKRDHVGDLYYDRDTGYSYRFTQDADGGFSWQLVKDTDITKALADAAAAAQAAEEAKKLATIAVSSVDVEYAQSDSPTEAPLSGWTTTAPAWVDGKYIWTRTKTVDGSGQAFYSDPACLTGAKGATGAAGSPGAPGEQGADGVGVSAIEEQYYLSTSTSEQVGGSWSAEQPKWSEGHYIWTRSKVTWTDGTTTYTTPVLAKAINSANESAHHAQTTADGKNRIFTQATEPAHDGLAQGDLWRVTNSSGQVTSERVWNGAAFVAHQISASSVIVPGSVNTTVIADGAITTGKINADAVTAEKIAANAVTAEQIAANAVTAAKIAAGSVGADKIAANAVTAAKIVAKAVTAEKISLLDLQALGATIGGLIIDLASLHSRNKVAYDDSNAGVFLGNDGTFGVGNSSNYITFDGENLEISAENVSIASGSLKDAIDSSIQSVEVTYQAGSSGTTAPTGTWSTNIPSVGAGQYLWTRTVTTYGDSSKTTQYSVARQGADGAKGATGAQGPQGPKGDKGATGAQGPQGDTGATGPQGPKGDKGDTGAKGATGATGSKALQPTHNWTGTFTTVGQTATCSTSDFNRTPVVNDTFTNLDGSSHTGTWKVTAVSGTSVTIKLLSYVNSKGATGATGPQGPKGATGATGPQGPKGDTGATGPQGPKGDKGATGAAGANGKMLYGTCSTAAATAAKATTISGFSLYTGVTVAVRFSYANTAASPTLNVSSTGAKAIYTNGVRYAYWLANATVVFTYDGTNWRVCSEPVYANTATVGNPSSRNVYIDGDSVDVRSGTTVLSTFTTTTAELGKNSSSAQVKMCGGNATVSYDTSNGVSIRSASHGIDLDAGSSYNLSVTANYALFSNRLQAAGPVKLGSGAATEIKGFYGPYTWVGSVSNYNEAAFMDANGFKSKVGRAYNTSKDIVLIMNADGDARNVAPCGVIYRGSQFIAHFVSSFTGSVRINYIIIAAN